MNWFYALNGQQAGPVDDADLARLAEAGTITDSTLVWHGGMANWQPYASVRPGAGVATLPGAPVDLGKPAAAGTAQCSQCGRLFPADEVVQIGSANVCAECKPLFMQRLRETGLTPGVRLAFAGFWIRLGAAILDFLILVPLYLAVGFGLYFLTGLRNVNFSDQQSVQIYFSHTLWPLIGGVYALSLLQGIYSAFCVSRFGGTPGKRICGLRVVHGLESQRVSFLRGLGRYASKVLLRAVPYLGRLYMIVDALFIAFDGEKRALHDMICNTRVIHDEVTPG